MKILLKRVDERGLWDGIWKAYEDDAEMADIHILKGATLEEMVRYTYEQNREEVEKAGQKFYQVLLPDKTLIGYTTLILVEPVRILFAFGINIRYRNREILTSWLKSIDGRLGRKYILTLRLSNERAMKFFRRNGFNVKVDTENNQYILWRQQQ